MWKLALTLSSFIFLCRAETTTSKTDKPGTKASRSTKFPAHKNIHQVAAIGTSFLGNHGVDFDYEERRLNALEANNKDFNETDDESLADEEFLMNDEEILKDQMENTSNQASNNTRRKIDLQDPLGPYRNLFKKLENDPDLIYNKAIKGLPSEEVAREYQSSSKKSLAEMKKKQKTRKEHKKFCKQLKKKAEENPDKYYPEYVDLCS